MKRFVIGAIVTFFVCYFCKVFIDWNALWFVAIPQWAPYERTPLLYFFVFVPAIAGWICYVVTGD